MRYVNLFIVANNRLVMTNRGVAMRVVCSAPVITSPRAPKHYGSDGFSVWYQARDAGQKKLWDPWDEVWRCEVMVWFIHKVGLSMGLVTSGTVRKDCFGITVLTFLQQDDELVREKKLKIAFSSVWPGTAIPTGDALTVIHTLRESGAATAPPHPFGSTYKDTAEFN